MSNVNKEVLNTLNRLTTKRMKIQTTSYESFKEIINHREVFMDDIYDYTMFIHSNWQIVGCIPQILEDLDMTEIFKLNISYKDEFVQEPLIFKSSLIDIPVLHLKKQYTIPLLRVFLKLTKC